MVPISFALRGDINVMCFMDAGNPICPDHDPVSLYCTLMDLLTCQEIDSSTSLFVNGSYVMCTLV